MYLLYVLLLPSRNPCFVAVFDQEADRELLQKMLRGVPIQSKDRFNEPICFRTQRRDRYLFRRKGTRERDKKLLILVYLLPGFGCPVHVGLQVQHWAQIWIGGVRKTSIAL